MDTGEYDLLDLKMVCSLLESGTSDENLEETLSSLRERHSDRLRTKMAGLMDQALQGMILLMC